MWAPRLGPSQQPPSTRLNVHPQIITLPAVGHPRGVITRPELAELLYNVVSSSAELLTVVAEPAVRQIGHAPCQVLAERGDVSCERVHGRVELLTVFQSAQGALVDLGTLGNVG